MARGKRKIEVNELCSHWGRYCCSSLCSARGALGTRGSLRPTILLFFPSNKFIYLLYFPIILFSLYFFLYNLISIAFSIPLGKAIGRVLVGEKEKEIAKDFAKMIQKLSCRLYWRKSLKIIRKVIFFSFIFISSAASCFLRDLIPDSCRVFLWTPKLPVRSRVYGKFEPIFTTNKKKRPPLHIPDNLLYFSWPFSI